jgi:pimeloyl-ACP methyl ester carboxylesterase
VFRFFTSASIAGIVCSLLLSGVVGCSAHPVDTAVPPTTSSKPAGPPPNVWLPLDDFYTPPAAVPPAPGALVRSAPLTDRLLPPRSRAWRIMYTTTRPDGAPAVAVATVLAPERLPRDPSPVILWQHGTVGVKQKCMPSTITSPFEGVPALEQVVDNGWVVVATDYEVNADGVIPYLIGEGEARSALDSLRAARHMPELRLDNRAVVWGHSQGGQSALWTGIARPGYAPDVALVGVAAAAPATDLEQLARIHVQDPSAAVVGPYLATSYSQYYPDVKFDDVLPEGAREISREIVDLCPEPKEYPRLQQLGTQLGAATVLAPSGPFADRLRENAPNHPIDVPLLVIQGLDDLVVPPSVTDTYVDQRCADKQELAYWRVRGRDHNSLLAGNGQISDMLVSWTEDRLAHKPQTGCQTTTLRG